MAKILVKNRSNDQNIGDLRDFYKNYITRHNALLERWYVKNMSVSLYFKLIILTILVVPNCNIDIEKILKINKSYAVGDGEIICIHIQIVLV